jgi:hypothetical protein
VDCTGNGTSMYEYVRSARIMFFNAYAPEYLFAPNESYSKCPGRTRHQRQSRTTLVCTLVCTRSISMKPKGPWDERRTLGVRVQVGTPPSLLVLVPVRTTLVCTLVCTRSISSMKPKGPCDERRTLGVRVQVGTPPSLLVLVPVRTCD